MLVLYLPVHHEEQMTINCTSMYLPTPPHRPTTRPTLPYIPTTRMTRPTTKRLSIPPTRASTINIFLKTTRRMTRASTTHPYLRSTAPPQLTWGLTTPPGGSTTHRDVTVHRPTTARTQPVRVEKGRRCHTHVDGFVHSRLHLRKLSDVTTHFYSMYWIVLCYLCFLLCIVRKLTCKEMWPQLVWCWINDNGYI